MQNKIEILKNKIFNKDKEYDLIEVWHYFMLSYGYIPFDDFLNMDASIKDRLLILLNEMHEKIRSKK